MIRIPTVKKLTYELRDDGLYNVEIKTDMMDQETKKVYPAIINYTTDRLPGDGGNMMRMFDENDKTLFTFTIEE